jgi:hypothetical protein
MRSLLPMLLLSLLILPAPVMAEGEGAPPGAPAAQRSPSPDFLFAPPRGSVSFRWGWNVMRADSDWFSFTRDLLTLDGSDFSSQGIAGDVNFAVAPRVDIVGSAEWAGHSAQSEYRHLVDNNRLPIEQTTRVRQASITGGVRYALLPRGRTISSLAWVPSRVAPYVGGGLGTLWYDLLQYGDFVDIQDSSVFGDQLPSNGWTFMGYVNGGTDILLFKRLYATVDARYRWATTELDENVWTGFEPLDLSGFRLSAGISVGF